jgi:hypothetical protein
MRLTFLFAYLAGALAAEPAVRFGRDILPILASNCLGCHGQDPGNRMAGLRLDTRDGALAARKNGAAIVPGRAEQSLLVARIASSQTNKLMPPPYSHKPALTQAQIERIQQWIREGAEWEKHWSLSPPVRPATSGPRAIDELVTRRLQVANLRLSPSADEQTLRRRVSFDLTGLPPDPGVRLPYEAYVDHLLASPHFGERMAMWWLDVARYADTDGFQADESRTNWPWRDWVVEAFNRNQPFNEFTRDQFAGDLLPQATPEQIVATAFHRNHMTNGEGGRDREESRIDYVLDRTNTMGTAWMGLTLGCAQCHDHKFDPIAQRDYYSLTAFFNNIDETGQAGKKAAPYLRYQSKHVARAIAEAEQLVAQRRQAEAQARAAARPFFDKWLAQARRMAVPGYRAWMPVKPTRLEAAEGSVLVSVSDGSIRSAGPNPKQEDYRIVFRTDLPVSGLRLEVLPDQGEFSRASHGEFILTDVKLQVRSAASAQIREVRISGAIADYTADKSVNNNYGDIKDTLDDDPRNGWTTRGAPKTPHVALYELAEPLRLLPGEEAVFEMRHRSMDFGANIRLFRLSATSERDSAVREIRPTPFEELARGGSISGPLADRLFAQFARENAAYRSAREALDRAEEQLADVRRSGEVDVMVLADRAKPRESHVLVRGVWDKKGEAVSPATPDAIAPWPANAPRNRLGLAQWLLSRDNPLTARVVVNQFWQSLFGAGLVRTTEDFGVQGDLPEHKELLDWLAVEFVESGWDVKHLLRLIVTSDTYRQRSTVSPALLAQDPENRLLARGARYRLPSWMLRDAALAYAGQLNRSLGGPPVQPPQPDGVWEELFMGRFQYRASEGAARYRRTLYAFWRRSIAPTFLFDNAQRRSCEVRTGRTNTPLQALTLLNDENYLEAARVLARRSSEPAKIFETILGHAPDARQLAVLRRERERSLRHFRANPLEARKLMQDPAATPDAATAMILASLILNLDEAITHE